MTRPTSSSSSASALHHFRASVLLEDTPSTSATPTIFEPHRDSNDKLEKLEKDLEDRLEHYGGDDVRDPTSTRAVSPTPSPTLKEETSKYVTWDGPDDPTNPQNWSVAHKWHMTVLWSLLTLNVTFASSAPSTMTFKIIARFHISSEISYLLTSLFLLGYVFGPLFWGPGSELVGRRPVMLMALSAYTILHLGQALAPNIETLLVTRFLGGFFAVAPLTIGGGAIADMWDAVGRGPATSLFSASVFLGPVLGPVVGGFIAHSSAQWYWIFWVMMIFAGVCTVIAFIFLPETYAPVILLNKAKKLRHAAATSKDDTASIYAEHEDQDWSISGVVHRTIYRPFKMLALEPILVLVTVYLSIVYGVLYAQFQAIPLIFIRTRGFTAWQSGLIFIGVGVGTTVGAIINLYLSRHYPVLIKQWKGFPPPEQRLFGAMWGGPLLVIASFWMGWTGQYPSVPWYVPALGTIVLGAAISLIFMSFLSYLVDTYLMYAASAFAANTVLRSLVGAAFPLFTVQMYTKLGINWSSTLIGFIGLLFAPSPFLFYKYGARIRESSKFAPCIDLEIAKAMAEEKNLSA